MAPRLHALPAVFSLLLLNALKSCFADLPQELDPFLERLFETTECESFLSDGSYLAVATRDCPPHRCDFPRQLCMRPSAQYQQESANECRDLPDQCLLAANGGQPLPTAAPPTESPAPRNLATSAAGGTQQPKAEIATTAAASLVVTARPPTMVSPPPRGVIPICEQGPPEGRFCGFSLKFAYNRETRNCDQFWFPGCRTERTNENLFDTLGECLQAVKHCARADPIFRPQQPRPVAGPSQNIPMPPPDSQSFVSAFGNGGPAPSPYQQPQPSTGVEMPFGQAGQFIRLITGAIREARGGAGGQQGGGAGGQGLRWDPSQLGGLLQSLGGRRRR